MKQCHFGKDHFGNEHFGNSHFGKGYFGNDYSGKLQLWGKPILKVAILEHSHFDLRSFWKRQIPFYDFLSHFEKTEWMNEGEHDFDTLAGFVLHELEHIPVTAERFEWNGFDIEIIDMDGQRIDKLLVKVSEEIKDEMED